MASIILYTYLRLVYDTDLTLKPSFVIRRTFLLDVFIILVKLLFNSVRCGYYLEKLFYILHLSGKLTFPTDSG